ncbi:type IV secretion system protein [bacterium]|nr:MAG: type IV secretion system protein [bacterium]
MNHTTDILTKVDAITLGYTAKAFQAVADAHAVELRLMLVAYFALFGIAVFQGMVPLTTREIAKHVLKAILVFSIATNWGNFTVFFYNTFTSGPDKLMSALIGGSAPSAQLGVVFDKGMAAASQIFENAGKWDLGQMLVAFIVMVSTVLLTAYALFLLVLSKMGLAILLSLGPVFIALALWPATKGLFQAWLNYVINYALIPALTLAFLGLIISILEGSVLTIEQVGDRPLIYHTLPYLLTGSVTILLLGQVPRLASSLGSGVALSTEGAFQRLLRSPGQSKAYVVSAAALGGKLYGATKPAYHKAGTFYRKLRTFGETRPEGNQENK